MNYRAIRVVILMLSIFSLAAQAGIPNDIKREIGKHSKEIKTCYDKEVDAGKPNLRGKVTVHFVIGSSGDVIESSIASTTLKNAPTETCLLEIIRAAKFPPFQSGGSMTIDIPFTFKPAKK